MMYSIFKNISRVILYCSYKISFEGQENLPQGGGYILVCNHRTNADPLFLAFGIKTQLHFMAKAELFKTKLTKAFFMGVGAFPVERGRGDSSALEWAEKILAEGKVLAMFPEGTRSVDGVPLRPKSGASMIAMQSGADILPCAVCFKGKLKFRTPVIIRYGELIPNDQLGYAEKTPVEVRKASHYMMDQIIKLLEA